MERRITVKGTGQIKRKPDLVVIDLSLEELDLNYEKAMAMSAKGIEALRESVSKVGFSRDSLKTTNFNVDTRYRTEQDGRNNYQQIFEGYSITHGIRLEFDWNQDLLTKALTAIAATKLNPSMDIRFSIKDSNAVMDELLVLATENAKKKAQVLTEASGVSLGELITIDYNWSDIRFYSDTNYMMREKMMVETISAPAIEPEDVSVSDSASFVWAIK